MPTAELTREYRAIRRQWPAWPLPARDALAAARRELALQEAEHAGRIRFRVLQETDPTWPADWGWSEEDAAAYIREVEAGRYEVLLIDAEVPKRCPNCGNALEDEWTYAASLGDVHVTGPDDPHVREVMRELADELGVLDS